MSGKQQNEDNNANNFSKGEQVHLDTLNNTMQNSCDNTMASLNNLSFCQINMSQDMINIPKETNVNDLKQNSKSLDSVPEEDIQNDDEIVRQASVKSISEEEKIQVHVSPKQLSISANENKTLSFRNRVQYDPNNLPNANQSKIIPNFIEFKQFPEQQNQTEKQPNQINLIESIHLSQFQSKVKSYKQFPLIPLGNVVIPQATGNSEDAKGLRKVSEQKISCKICLDEQGPFLTPCKCAGSCSQIHEKCLKDWILQQQKNKKKVQNSGNNSQEIALFYTQLPEAKCEICQYKYQYQTIYKSKFSFNCLKSCDQSTQNFTTGFIGSLLSCFMIFLIIVMFTNSPFETNSSNNSNNSNSNTSKGEGQASAPTYPQNPNQQNENNDNSSNDNKPVLQQVFICLSFVILTVFLIITIKCCKKALWLKKVVSWKILGYGEEPQQESIEIKPNTVIPASIISATQINMSQSNNNNNNNNNNHNTNHSGNNNPHAFQQTQVRSNVSRLMNNSQFQRNNQNNIIPIIPQPQQPKMVVTQSALRTSRF